MNIYLLGKKSNQLIYKILSLKTSCDIFKIPKNIKNKNYMYGGGYAACGLTPLQKREIYLVV